MAAGAGAALAAAGSGDKTAPPASTAAPSRTTSSVDDTSDERPTTTPPTPVVTTTDPVPQTSTTIAEPPPTPSTTPPAASYPTHTVMDDPAHLVQIWLPEVMAELPTGDSTRIWTFEDVTFRWVDDGPGSAGDALALHDSLVRELRTVSTDTIGAQSDQDGAFIVSGHMFDGTIVYHRYKIRCGDLVGYSIEVAPNPSAASDRIGGQIPNDLYSTTADGDAMGGVHPVC
ncbi:MAG: hypothetical protein KF906_05035 [Actinobacteria bacterium]|nr:hypothetical protein [Actinomycetota bacterium]